MDRETAAANIRTGLAVAGIALAVLGLTFFAAILYIGMSENGRAPAPTELVYVPGNSWTPVFVAFGLAGLLVGIFAGWVWAVAGGVLGLLGAAQMDQGRRR